MEPVGSAGLASSRTLLTLAFVLGGAALGTVSGLVPGLHANNFALLLAAVAADAPGPPLLIGAAMLSAGVVHTFLDAVPALALGVPDAAMAATALPGHRLVIQGRGREAIRLSALGSGLGAVFALAVALPVTAAMVAYYPVVADHRSLVLGLIVLLLVATEPTPRAALAGIGVFALSGALGALALPIDPAAPLASGGMLTPLFAGLFGAPVLLDAIGGVGVPEQDDPAVTASRRAVAVAAGAGALGGALVGYLPGVSSAVAAVVVFAALPGSAGDRGYVVATSGVNTANTVVALFALASLGLPRTGVLVAFDRVGAPIHLPVLLSVVGLAAVYGLVGLVAFGDRYLLLVGRVDPARLSIGVCCLLVVLSAAFAGLSGVVVFLLSTLVGLVPVRVRTRRVHLMGVLIGPLVLS